MQVLVTGGAGFIGSHLVDSLVDAGHDVLLIDNLHTGRQANVNTKAMFYRMDLTDHAALGQVFTRNEIQAVFHLGARVNVRESMQDPVGYAAVNVSASLALMELSRAAGVEQFVFISSGGAVYGEGKQADGSHKAFSETDPINPKDNYAANKLAIEQHLALYREAYDFPSAVLRFANIYGPRQNPEAEAGVVAIFIEAMLKNREVRIHGDGTQARDFLYVSDAVDSCLSALKHRARGVFNVGSGQPTTVNEIFQKLASLTHYHRAPVNVERPVGEVDLAYLNTSLARSSWGWSNRVDLQQGLTNVVKHVQAELQK